MDWKSLSGQIAPDEHYSERTRRLIALNAVLDGTQYDHIAVPFSQEKDGAGDGIPMHQRRPSVKTGLCRVVTSQAVSLLFSESRFPRIRGATSEISDRMTAIVKAIGLQPAMSEAALFGSVGSVAILVRFMAGRVFVDPLKTTFLTPTFDPADPSRLLHVRERYKVRGADLAAAGYEGIDPKVTYWWNRQWDSEAETIFQPVPLTADQTKPLRVLRQTPHILGRVPIVWVKNLPGGTDPEGASTFEAGIDAVIALDYLESQAHRALRYMGDPTVVVSGANNLEGAEIAKGANTMLVLDDPQGNAKLLEIDGGSAAAFHQRGQALRHIALEAMHGNRSNPDKIAAATSGRAMELLHQDQIWLASSLRDRYGPAIMAVLDLIGLGAGLYDVQAAGEQVAPFDTSGLSLAWGAWFDPTYGDIVSFTSGLSNAVDGGIISHETATHVAAPVFDIADVKKERALIQAEAELLAQRVAQQNGQVRATVTETN